jgi:hypothetical protein
MIANEAQFRKPHVRLRALGVSYERGSPRQQISGGIASPVEYRIPKGTELYRFGQNGVPELVAMGEWWIDGDTLRQIEAYARARSISTREGIRQTCYVPAEWSALDIVVHARTVSELLAYRGRGGVVSVKNKSGQTTTHMAAQGDHRVQQLYIPGFASGDVRRDGLGFVGFSFLPR